MKRRRGGNPYRNNRSSLSAFKEFLADNKKRVMPIILLICLAGTILYAIVKNKEAADKAIADADRKEEVGVGVDASEAVLSKDSYPEINALIAKYFEAYVSGDTTILNSGIYRTLDEIESVTVEERAKYIEEIRDLAVYTKPGPVENSWVAYVYTEIRYIGCDDFLPGVLSFYICRDDSGEYYINADESAQSIKDYINAISLQDDVVELFNKVNVEYKERLDADPMLEELVGAIYAEIDESVGERLAGADVAVADAQAQASAGNEGGKKQEGGSDASGSASTQKELPKEVKIRATTTVNVRSSDSTEAAVLGKAREGEEYVRILEQPNGWSKISFAGSAAYVKSEFFEIVTGEETPAQTDAGTGASAENAGAQEGASAAAVATASTGSTSASAAASTGASSAASAGTSKASSSAASTAASSASTGASTGTSTGASTGASTAASTAASAGSSASAAQTASTQSKSGVTGTGKKMVNGNGVRIRTSPDTESDIVTTLYFGTQVEVTKNRSDGWSEINYNGKTAYVKTEFLQDL